MVRREALFTEAQSYYQRYSSSKKVLLHQLYTVYFNFCVFFFTVVTQDGETINHTAINANATLACFADGAFPVL